MNTAVLEVPRFRRDRKISISLKKYEEKMEDARLLAVAEERLKHFDSSKLVSQQELDAKLGITEKDLEGWEDVEIE